MVVLLLGIYWLVLAVYAWFSYAMTADNLILSYWQPFFDFQWYMWNTFSYNRTLLTTWYLSLIILSFCMYAALIISWWNKRAKPSGQLPTPRSLLGLVSGVQWRKAGVVFGLLLATLMFSNNALSYDVFNYIFNAKMVVVYRANPHVKTAFEYDHDDWVKFMHNTHTAAPYGYTWTGLSLIPYVAGGGNFLLIWLLFRVMSVLSLVGLGWAVVTTYRRNTLVTTIPIWALAIFFLNPLVLIEVVSNFHNDLWMMAPAIASLGLIGPRQSSAPLKKRWLTFGLSGALLLFSISVKLVTVLLVPLWLLMVWYWLNGEKRFSAQAKTVSFLNQLISLITYHWPLWSSLALFVPLLTTKSQLFHPWYLTWVLAFIPLFPLTRLLSNSLPLTGLLAFSRRVLGVIQDAWLASLLVLSLSSLLRYYSFLQVGSYVPEVLIQRLQITWWPFGIALVLSLAVFTLKEVIWPITHHSRK
jgi:hypothetical protein